MANLSAFGAEVCHICCDRFSSPRILHCRHTFCRYCILGLIRTSPQNDEITCPLCRIKIKLREDSRDTLLHNYFVPLENTIVPPTFYCGGCLQEAILEECSHCSEQLCTACRSSHLLALKLSDNQIDQNSPGDECPEDGLSDEEQRLNLPQIFLSNHPTKVQINATLVASCRIDSMYSTLDLNGAHLVRSIRQTQNNTFLVLQTFGPEVVEYDSTGEEVKRHYLQGEAISDFIYLPGGDILYSMLQNGLMLKMDARNNVTVFTQSVLYQPFCLSRFQDGRIVAGGPAFQRQDGNDHGAIQIYDTKGNLAREIVQCAEGKFVKFPISVAVSDRNEICATDKDSKYVYIFSESGAFLSWYDGGIGMEPSDFYQFLPSSLCYDNEGNILVANFSDGIIHVLAPSGDFKGYILTENLEGFRRVSSICINEAKIIAVGDREDNTIRFYSITSFKNIFQ